MPVNTCGPLTQARAQYSAKMQLNVDLFRPPNIRSHHRLYLTLLPSCDYLLPSSCCWQQSVTSNTVQSPRIEFCFFVISVFILDICLHLALLDHCLEEEDIDLRKNCLSRQEQSQKNGVVRNTRSLEHIPAFSSSPASSGQRKKPPCAPASSS